MGNYHLKVINTSVTPLNPFITRTRVQLCPSAGVDRARQAQREIAHPE